MNTDKLTDAMNMLDDEIIEKAHEPIKTTKKTSVRWLYPVAAAVVCVAAVLIFVIVNRDLASDIGITPTIVYASEFSQGELLYYDSNSKITVGESLRGLKEGDCARLAIVLHEFEEAYPEYGFTWFDGSNWEDYLEFKAYVVEKESAFLEECGATDIVKTDRAVVLCTMNIEAIQKLNRGKCNYTVVLYTADAGLSNDIDISAYNGDYKHCSFVAVSPFSSFRISSEFAESGHLVIKDGLVSVSFSEGTLGANISYDNYTVKKVDNKDFDEIMDVMYSQSAAYMELRYAERVTYEIFNSDGNSTLRYIYLTNDSIYLDLGLRGMYKFN